MVKRKTIFAPYGNSSVISAELAYVDIITVKRNGEREYPIEDYPTGTEKNFNYEEGLGKIQFSNDRPFNYDEVDANGFVLPTFIHILYKERA